jgi:ABC-type transporter Mla MlaB component
MNLSVQTRGDTHVLEGVLDEQSPPILVDLSRATGTASSITLDVGGLRRINSLGVRAWVEFMRGLSGRKVHFVRCSPAFVDQLNTVSDFRSGAQIDSVLAPYVCERTGRVSYEELKVGIDIKRGGDFSALGERRCEECPEGMVFDDVPERYLHFLNL